MVASTDDKKLNYEAICGHECCRKFAEYMNGQKDRLQDARQRIWNHHEWIDCLAKESDATKDEVVSKSNNIVELKQRICRMEVQINDLVQQHRGNLDLKHRVGKVEIQVSDIHAERTGRARTPARRPSTIL